MSWGAVVMPQVLKGGGGGVIHILNTTYFNDTSFYLQLTEVFFGSLTPAPFFFNGSLLVKRTPRSDGFRLDC